MDPCPLRSWSALALAPSCSAPPSNPAQPSAVVGLPSVIPPADNSQVLFASQPLMLVVSDATIGGAITATYTFEVATDSAFADKVQTKSVSQGILRANHGAARSIATSKDYYWHVRAEAGAPTASSHATKFTVVPLGAPTPAAPANGAVVSGWPTLVVNNVQKSGTTGALVYRFDISTSSSFGSIATSGTVAEGSGQTSFTPSGATPTGQATLFWRASAIDQGGGVTGPASTTQSFRVELEPGSEIAAEEGMPCGLPRSRRTRRGTHYSATAGIFKPSRRSTVWSINRRPSTNCASSTCSIVDSILRVRSTGSTTTAISPMRRIIRDRK